MPHETLTDEADCLSRLTELNERGDTLLAIALCETAPCSLDVQCQRYRGWIYVDQGQPEKASEWYLKAALQGDSKAIEECWKCIFMIDASGNKEKAIELCKTPPMSDYLECQRYLAKAYFLQGDQENLLLWSIKIAEHGAANDLLYVGILYRSKGQPDLALDFLKRAAVAGNNRAHQLLGEMYAFGLGVSADKEKAILHYRESAQAGYLLSQVRLSHIKRKQDGIIGNLIFLVRSPLLVLRALIIKSRNPNDPHLADIPGRSNTK